MSNWDRLMNGAVAKPPSVPMRDKENRAGKLKMVLLNSPEKTKVVSKFLDKFKMF